MSPPSLVPGTLFANDYTVIRELDRGGMGVVYEVEQRSIGRRRALKVILPEVAESPLYRDAFLREARVGSTIDSEHVVEVTAAGYDEPSATLWLAMEFLRGGTLAARVARLGPLPPAELLATYRQVGHALTAAHRAGVVHCDLKPENVFLCETRRADTAATVKVLDFDIAKVIQEYRTSTLATSIQGSPRWMAPEQATDGGRIKPATDVWALGLMAFHLLTGTHYWRHAQRNGGVMPLLGEMMTSNLVAASHRAREHGFQGELPPGFDAWFARCVVRDVDRRFAEVSEAVDALAGAIDPPRVNSPVAGTVLLSEGDGEANALRLSMRQAEAAGDFAGAAAFGERLLACRRPVEGDVDAVRLVLLSLARRSERDGDRPAALAWADRAVALKAKHPWALYLRSQLRLRAGDVVGALADDEAIELSAARPTEMMVHGARLRHAAGQLAVAAARWAALAGAHPSEPGYRAASGAAWTAARDWERAEEAFTQAIDLAPRDGGARWRRGVVRMERGDLAGAKADLDEAVRLDPARGDGWYARCQLARRLGDANGAWRDLARAAECGHALAVIERGTSAVGVGDLTRPDLS